MLLGCGKVRDLILFLIFGVWDKYGKVRYMLTWKDI